MFGNTLQYKHFYSSSGQSTSKYHRPVASWRIDNNNNNNNNDNNNDNINIDSDGNMSDNSSEMTSRDGRQPHPLY